MLKRITLAIGLLLAPTAALAQSSVLPYFVNSSGVKTQVGSSNPFPIVGSISASLAPFTPGLAGARGTPLTVTVADSSGNLPTNTGSVIIYNVGANPMYCNVNGIAATTADQYISSAGGWFNFGVPAGTTTLHCIATGGSTTANAAGGTGLGAGTGGGSGGAGGGGAITAASGSYASGALSSGSIASGAYASGSIGSGAVASGAYASGSIASGAMVDLGSQADAACGTGTGTCSLIALTKFSNATAPILGAGSAVIGSLVANQTVNTAQINGVAPLMGNGQTGTGAQRMTLSQDSASAAINVSTATDTQIVALSGSTVIYVTSFDVVAGGTGNITFEYGTGSNCATGKTALTGAYPLTAQAGISKGSGVGTILKVPAGNALCVLTSAAVQMSGSVSYIQF